MASRGLDNVATLEVVKFLHEDTDNLFYRRFTELHLYNLCLKHGELADLDSQLHEIKARLRHINRSKSPSRQETEEKRGLGDELDEINGKVDEKLRAYGKALKMYERVRKDGSPSGSQRKTTRQSGRLKGHIESDEQWLDVALAVPMEKGWIHRLIDRHGWFREKLVKQEVEAQMGTHRWAAVAAQRVDDLVMYAIASVLTVAPIFVLSFVRNKVAQLMVIIGSVLAASCVISFACTQAQRSGLAATAAYTAILVVFVTNNESGP